MTEYIAKRKSPYWHDKVGKSGTRNNFSEDPEVAVTEDLRRHIGVHYDGNPVEAAQGILNGEFPDRILKPLFKVMDRNGFPINQVIYDALTERKKRKI